MLQRCGIYSFSMPAESTLNSTFETFGLRLQLWSVYVLGYVGKCGPVPLAQHIFSASELPAAINNVHVTVGRPFSLPRSTSSVLRFTFCWSFELAAWSIERRASCLAACTDTQHGMNDHHAPRPIAAILSVVASAPRKCRQNTHVRKGAQLHTKHSYNIYEHVRCHYKQSSKLGKF